MINKDRPAYYPLHDELGTNTVLPEDSNFRQQGYPTGLPVPSGDHNGKLNSSGQWVSFNDATQLRLSDWLDTANIQALTSSRLTYTNGGNVLTTGAVVATRGAYLLVGGRFETDDAFLNPVGATTSASPLVFPTATLPGRIWLYASTDGDLRVSSVGPADADAPAVNEMTLVGLQIDGVGLVTNGAIAPVTLPLPARSLDIVSPTYITGAMEIDGTGTMLAITAAQSEGGDVGVTIEAGPGPGLTVNSSSPSDFAAAVNNTAGSALQVSGVSAATGALSVSGSTGRGIVCTTTGANSGIRITASSTGHGLDVTRTGSGVGIYSDTTGGTGYAVQALGPVGGTSLYASTATGNAIEAVATGTGVGVRGLGGASSSSLALRGESTHDDAFAIQGITSATASIMAAGVLGSGRNAGAGVYGFATGTGFGIVAQADTTSPSRAALLLIPQDADPTTGASGSLLYHSGRGPTGKLRTYTTQWESVHSSTKGRVFTWGNAAAGGPIAGGSGNLSLAQITPEETGDVLILGTGSLEFSSDTGVCSVALVDVTSAITVAIQTERAIDTDAVAPNVRSFAIQGIRTLPSTVTRTFAIVITASVGTITYTNVICRVDGVQ